MRRLGELLAAAQRPFAVVGGSRWTAEAVEDLQEFAASWDLPVGCSFRRQMLFDHLHPAYAGDVALGINPKLRQRLAEADLLLLLGGRFSEVPSQGFSMLGIPEPAVPVVHVHPGAEELGRIYRPALAINATPGALLASAPRGPGGGSRIRQAHADYLDWSTPQPDHGALQFGEIVHWLRDHLPEDAVITNGAGNYSIWLHRFFRYRRFGTQLAPVSGSMGYGLPAAIAAGLRHRDRPVVCLAGDGCFQMTGQEFATAVQYRVPLVVVLWDNGMYGTIRMHQSRAYPGRVTATSLVNPDFAALARACGGFGETVTDTAGFVAAFERAVVSELPALIHLKPDPVLVAPGRVLTDG
jgi:acetolactate synthase-1/2/3 large subunit